MAKIKFWGYSDYNHMRYVAFCNKATFIRTILNGGTRGKSWILERMSETANPVDIQTSIDHPNHVIQIDNLIGSFTYGQIIKLIPFQ